MYIIVYDIPQEYPHIRQKISQILKDGGLERIEYSVFKGYISRNEAETIAMVLERIIGRAPADVRLYAVCENCQHKSITVKENPIFTKVIEEAQFI